MQSRAAHGQPHAHKPPAAACKQEQGQEARSASMMSQSLSLPQCMLHVAGLQVCVSSACLGKQHAGHGNGGHANVPVQSHALEVSGALLVVQMWAHASFKSLMGLGGSQASQSRARVIAELVPAGQLLIIQPRAGCRRCCCVPHVSSVVFWCRHAVWDPCTGCTCMSCS